MMDAVIFDFDGVVVDSEPVHLACFQEVLRTVGVELTRQEYYAEYLGYDDHDCLLIAARNKGVDLDEEQIAALTAEKTHLVQRTFERSIEALPGAAELIGGLAREGVPLAVCSGALREEIELAARAVGVRECFTAIVSAEDVSRGKPDPEGYRLARRRLEQALGRSLDPARCVVVEDAPAGIRAARKAGMKVLAVATSYPPEALAAADRVVVRLTEAAPADLRALL